MRQEFDRGRLSTKVKAAFNRGKLSIGVFTLALFFMKIKSNGVRTIDASSGELVHHHVRVLVYLLEPPKSSLNCHSVTLSV